MAEDQQSSRLSPLRLEIEAGFACRKRPRTILFSEPFFEKRTKRGESCSNELKIFPSAGLVRASVPRCENVSDYL
jgi:hypothetical protein